MATNNWLCSPNINGNNFKNHNKNKNKSKNKNKNNNKFKKFIIKTMNFINSIYLKRLAFMTIILSTQFQRMKADSVIPTIMSAGFNAVPNQPNLARSSLRQQHSTNNLLINDEIEHEKLIENNSNKPHIRKKRLVWITDDGRLALPPGTSLTITPTLALPFIRHPPEGFFSNMSISFPLTIDFDKLGLTDNQNPLGDFPPLFARSFGHAAGEMVGNYVARYIHYKRKRDLHDQRDQNDGNFVNTKSGFRIKRESIKSSSTLLDDFPELPDRFKHIFHGGERVMLYMVVEDFLSTFGLNGKACLLRTICEIHSRNLDHFGVIGEMVKLFLTVTKSPFSDLIPEYQQAQEIGEGRKAPGECYPYYKDCPKSIFKAMQDNKYSKQQNYEHDEELVGNQSPVLDSNTNPNEIHDRREKFFSHSLSM